MDIIPQHFKIQVNNINTVKENIMNLTAIRLKVRFKMNEHKTNLDNALLVDGIYNN